MFGVLIHRLGLFKELPGLNLHTVLSFAAATLAGYNSANEFHNMCHGLHVAQATYLLLRETLTHTVLRSDEVLTLMIAALGHDLDHTGTNSFFLANSGSNLATRYNDNSVLENYHCASLSTVLAVEDFAVFDFATPKQQGRLRKLMVSTILWTDMSRHLELVNTIKNLPGTMLHPSLSEEVHYQVVDLESGDVTFDTGAIATYPRIQVDAPRSGSGAAEGEGGDHASDTAPVSPHGEEWEEWEEEGGGHLTRSALVFRDATSRANLCGILLHCADISGQATPWSTAKDWSACVIAEFRAQAQMEVALDVEQPTFMHSLDNTEAQGVLQSGFCKFVLQDLFGAMADLYPAVQNRLAQVLANRDRHDCHAKAARSASM
jgi:hypothetical protein